MKLVISPTSPYARKARITAIEAGLTGIDMVSANPFGTDGAVRAANPLGKVPALILDDGRLVVDSPVICAFLDAHGRAPVLLPDGENHFDVRTSEAIADGIIDAAVATVMERRREPGEQSPGFMERQAEAIRHALAYGEKDGCLDGAFRMDTIAWICALLYLEFRLPDLALTAPHERLMAALAPYRTRESVIATAPPTD